MIWAGIVLLLTVVLGGGTKAGFLGDAILQLIAVPLLIGSIFSLRWSRMGASARIAVALSVAFVGVGLSQLLPLMPSVALGADNGAPSSAISLSPRATLLALLSGLPAFAIFLVTLGLSLRQRWQLTRLLLGIGAVSILLGLLQVAEGPSSALRLYAMTNKTEAVGFFANRNHFAAFAYVILVLGAASAVEAVRRTGVAPAGGRFASSDAVRIILAMAGLAILLGAQIFARSRAGLALTMPALAGIAILAWRSHAGRGWSFTAPLAIAALLGVLLTTQFALFRLFERFGTDPLADARIPFAHTTLEAARAHVPFGAGLGTFVEVYGAFERPADALRDTFANRAHNDFLELWLETGVPGAVLIVGFVAWFLTASVAAWRAPRAVHASIDPLLARASSLIVLLLLLHSVVDYPLRTAALLSVFALACGFLVPPRGEGPDAAGAEDLQRVAFSRCPPERAKPWGDGTVWPEEWRAPRKSLEQPGANDVAPVR